MGMLMPYWSMEHVLREAELMEKDNAPRSGQILRTRRKETEKQRRTQNNLIAMASRSEGKILRNPSESFGSSSAGPGAVEMPLEG